MIDKESTTETTPEEVEESESENQATSDNEKDKKPGKKNTMIPTTLFLEAKAEVENIKKRSEKEISNAYKFSTESIFLDLIPIFESLDIAVSQDTDSLSKENLIEGNKLLKNMFDSLLEKNSLEVINPINEKFDPNLHQAIKTIENDKKDDNTVDEVLQKGYKLVGRVIKPALVVVIKNKLT